MGLLRVEIIVHQPGGSLNRYIVPEGQYLIGRDPTSDLPIDSPDVSRRHALLAVAADGCTIEDLGNTSGTWLEGAALQGTTAFKLPKSVRLGTTHLDLRYLTETELAACIDIVSPKAPPTAESARRPLPDSLQAIEKPRNYAVGAEAGHGGMGAVLQARDLNLDRTVAMKVILNSDGATEESRLRFIQEAKVLGQLEHPNIVPIYELGLDADGRVFYTMKFVHGVTLQRILDEIKAGQAETIAKYPLGQLLTVFQKVCDAVAFAHSKGVLHRDLKPENVMIGQFGEVQVMDWGLAKRTGGQPEALSNEKPELAAAAPTFQLQPASAPTQTLEGRVMGSPNYVAPEQAAGRINAIDARTDVYGLGAILYGILALRAPVLGRDLESILQLIRSGDIRSPSELGRSAPNEENPSSESTAGTLSPHLPGSKVPPPLSAVAMKALARRRSQRYQSVGDLQKDIAAYQNGFATQAEEAGLSRLARLWIQRHKAGAVAISIIAPLLALLVVSTLINRRRIDITVRALQQTAPYFLAKARDQIDEHNFASALASLDRAIGIRPESAKSHLLRGNLLQTQLRFREAAHAYGEALKRNPANILAQTNQDLCLELLALKTDEERMSLANLARLEQRMWDDGRYAEAESMLLRRLARDKELRDTHLSRWRQELERRAVRGKVEVDERGYLTLDLSYSSMTNLGLLKGIPLNGLNLENSKISNLADLKGMPLKSLILDNVPARDLSPLHGLPLEELRLGGNYTNLAALQGLRLRGLELRCLYLRDLRPLAGMPLARFSSWEAGIRDLRPLKGLPLTILQLFNAVAEDLTPLRGAPINQLQITRAPLHDLSPLHGMPLAHLELGGTQVRDLSPLIGAPLFHIGIDHTRVSDLTVFTNFPDLSQLELGGLPIRNLEPLKGMALHFLGLSETLITNLDVLRGMPLEHLLLERTEVQDLQPLVGAPILALEISGTKITNLAPVRSFPLKNLRISFTRITDLAPLRKTPLEVLVAWRSTVEDLGPLEGLPLIHLDLNDTPVSDLRPVRHTALRHLFLRRTRVTDLAPLAGMPLEELQLQGTSVRDIKPLQNMPLRKLFLHECPNLSDLRPLADCKSLEELHIPVQCREVSYLRALPKLNVLSYTDQETHADDFWREHDAINR